MKFQFLALEGKSPDWVVSGRNEYVTKISGFVPLEWKSLKTPAFDREQAAAKKAKEGELLLKHFGEKDLVVLFDEKGRLAKTSEDFSTELSRVLESGKQKVCFVIGGAYGFSDEVLKRANMKWSLSPLTMNHWLAQLAALEQIYRGLTLLKGIPYHNR